MTKRLIIWGLMAAGVSLAGLVSIVYRDETPKKASVTTHSRVPKTSQQKVSHVQKAPIKKVTPCSKRRVADRPVSWMEMFPEAVNLDVYLQVKPKRYSHPSKNVVMPGELLDGSVQSLDEAHEQDDGQEDEHEFFFDGFKRRKVSYGACKATPIFSDTWYDGGGSDGEDSYSPRSSSGGYSSQSRPSSASGSRREFDSPSQSRFSQSPKPVEYSRPESPSSSHVKKDNWPSYKSPAEHSRGPDSIAPQSPDDIDPDLLDDGVDGGSDDGTAVDGDNPVLPPSFDGLDGADDAQQNSFFGMAKQAIKTIMGPILGMVSPFVFNKFITPLWDSAYKLVSSWWNGANANATQSTSTTPANGAPTSAALTNSVPTGATQAGVSNQVPSAQPVAGAASTIPVTPVVGAGNAGN